MIDVAIAIDAEAIDVLHVAGAKDAGSYVDGEWIATPPAPVNIRATVQPASGRALRDLPEGVRVEARYLIWTRVPIKDGDLVTALSDDFRVIYTWPRRPNDAFTRGALGYMRPTPELN